MRLQTKEQDNTRILYSEFVPITGTGLKNGTRVELFRRISGLIIFFFFILDQHTTVFRSLNTNNRYKN